MNKVWEKDRSNGTCRGEERRFETRVGCGRKAGQVGRRQKKTTGGSVDKGFVGSGLCAQVGGVPPCLPPTCPPYLPDEQAVDPSPRKLDEVDVLLLQPRCQRWRGASHHLVNAEDRPLNPRLQGRRAGGEIRRCAMAGMLPCPSMILPLSPSLPPPL